MAETTGNTKKKKKKKFKWGKLIVILLIIGAVVIGLGGEILNLSPSRKLSDKARVMSAMFE